MRNKFSNGRVRVLVGLVLLAGLLIQCQRALNTQSSEVASPVAVEGPSQPRPGVAIAETFAPLAGGDESQEEAAARSPRFRQRQRREQRRRKEPDYDNQQSQH